MSSPLPQSTEDLLRSKFDGAPSWWPITSKEKWQDACQSLNWPLASKCRDMIQNRCWTPRSIGADLDIPEWLVMCLVGMPTNRWWDWKQEWSCTTTVRLP